jgi:hypothetical protein
MPQVNIRLSKEHQEFVRKLCEQYRTSVSQLFRGYVEYLEKGGVPIGYPQNIQVPPVPDKDSGTDT